MAGMTIPRAEKIRVGSVPRDATRRIAAREAA
jgi:hypothetical protein